jgi:opacity protein-like surface antigen
MTTKALLLGAVASIALAGTAQAHGGWYVGIEGGISSVEDADAVGTILGFATTGTLPIDSGWALMGTVGHELSPNWRIEGELGYRSNETDTGGTIEVTELSLMVNALFDIELGSAMDLSLGAGIGYDETTFDVGGVAEASDRGFAWQGIAGLSWAISPHTDLTCTYRYMNVAGPELSAGAGIATVDFDDLTKHSLTVGLRFNMGGGGE